MKPTLTLPKAAPPVGFKYLSAEQLERRQQRLVADVERWHMLNPTAPNPSFPVQRQRCQCSYCS